MKAVVSDSAEGVGRQNVLGHDIVVRLSAEQTGGSFTLFEQRSLPGSEVPLHWHESESETFHVLEGEVEFTVDGAVRRTGAGATLFVPPRVRHALRLVSREAARMLIFTVPGGIEAMFEELAGLTGCPEKQCVDALCARHGIHFL